MGIDILTLSAAKKYTDNSLSGAGGLKGTPCQIKTIKKVGKQNIVTFSWEDKTGVESTADMTVDDGINAKSFEIDANNHLIATLDDNTKLDCGELPATKVAISSDADNQLTKKPDGSLYVAPTDISGKVDKITGKGLSTNDYTNADKDKVSEIDDWAEYTSDGKLILRGFNGIELNTDDDSDVAVRSMRVSGKAAATQNVISDKYNSATAYNVGDLLIYDNQLYKVKATCQGITPPNVTYYAPTQIGKEIPNIQFGVFDVSVAANSTVTVDVPYNFVNTEGKTPTVFISPTIYTSPEMVDSLVLSTAQSYFKCRIKNNTSSAYNIKLHWLAIM